MRGQKSPEYKGRKGNQRMDIEGYLHCFSWRSSARKIAVWMAAAVFLGVGIASPGSVDAGGMKKNGDDQAVQRQPSGTHGDAGNVHGQDAKKIIAARVNGVEISQQMVTTMMNRIIAKKGHGDAPAEKYEETRRTALNRLILQELALQKAKAEGMKVEQEKVESVIDDLKVKLGGEEGFFAFLKKEEMTEKELAEQVERSLMLDMISAKEMSDRISIPEDDLRREYEREKEKFVRPEKVFVTDVVLFMLADDKQSGEKAAGILRRIQDDKGMNPWSLVPDGTFIVRDIELKKDKQGELYEAAKKLKEGELSGVIETPDSLHILKLRQYTPEQQGSFEEARGSIEARLKEKAQKERLQAWEEELKKNATIEIFETEGTSH
jgi:hypothetical protein